MMVPVGLIAGSCGLISRNPPTCYQQRGDKAQSAEHISGASALLHDVLNPSPVRGCGSAVTKTVRIYHMRLCHAELVATLCESPRAVFAGQHSSLLS